MKVALAVAHFLYKRGIRHVFCISGGASLHLIHGCVDQGELQIVCPQTEQAAGFAADSYARLKGLGCAIATSGPGFTNLVTPIAASYYDSIPVLYITGNVTTKRMSINGVRQTGFQETPAIEIAKRITKYAAEPMNPHEVIPELEMALRIAKSNRPGPVLISIPDDIQRAEL